jgi:hypothetical protein
MNAAVFYAFSLLEIGVLGIRTLIKRCEQLIQRLLCSQQSKYTRFYAVSRPYDTSKKVSSNNGVYARSPRSVKAVQSL